MRRRTLLAALGAAVPNTGCLTSDDLLGRHAATGDPPDTRTPSPEGPADGGTPVDGSGDDPPFDDIEVGDANIVDLETAPRTYALSRTTYRTADGAEVAMAFVDTATAEHPARVVAKLQNPMAVEQTFDLRWAPPFGRRTSEQPYPPGTDRWAGDHTYRVELVFAPTADDDLAENPPAVERAEDGYWRLSGGVSPWGPETVRLEPGETVRGEYALVGRAEGVGRGRPTGVYEFSRGQDYPVRIAVWNTDNPGPDGESRFAGETVPQLPRDGDVAWFHAADATTPSFVRPSVERTGLPAEVDFTFVNHDHESTGCGHWTLYKLRDGQWYDIGPYVRTADCRRVGPGGAKTWTLHAFHGEGLPCQGAAVFGHLGGGRYAAVAGYGHATARSAAMVELTGDRLAVTPTDDVDASSAGDRVVVESPRPERETRDPAVLTVLRADGAKQTLIAEQVMRRRFRGLRNTLSFFEPGVEAVELHTDDRVAEQVVGYDQERFRFTFREDAFEARVAVEG